MNDFNMDNEFENINFKSAKLKNRFLKTMTDLFKNPGVSILLASGSREAAKAVYRMFSNVKFNISEILKSHKSKTIERIVEYNKSKDEKIILLLQDTMSVNYNNHKKTEGLGYNSQKTLGVNIHSCLAVTPEGLALGVMEQSSSTREFSKTDSKTAHEKKSRPIEEKESFRWLKTLEESNIGIPSDIKTINICDREGDIYELFNKAIDLDTTFLIRIVQNRLTTSNEKIIDEIKKEASVGSIEVIVPRNPMKNIKKRNATLEISFKKFELKIPKIRNKNNDLRNNVFVNVIYLRETGNVEGIKPIEWLLMTNEPVSTTEKAFEMVDYYVQRWKIERFHYTLKSGCAIEKIQERTVNKISCLILMYSVIAIKIMNLTFLGRICPELKCNAILDEEEWKVLYCVANKTKDVPLEPYSTEDAIKYLSILGGFKRSKSDGPPGLKIVWIGLDKLHTLLECKEYLT